MGADALRASDIDMTEAGSSDHDVYEWVLVVSDTRIHGRCFVA